MALVTFILGPYSGFKVPVLRPESPRTCACDSGARVFNQLETIGYRSNSQYVNTDPGFMLTRKARIKNI